MKMFVLLMVLLSCLPCHFLFGQYSFELDYSTPQDEEILAGILHSSDDIYLAGRFGNFDLSHYYPLVMKISPEGDIEALQWFLQDTIGYFSQILELDNGNLMLIGQCGLSSENEYTKRWLRIIDPDLNILSDNIYSQDSNYILIYQNNSLIDGEGNVIVAGIVEFNDIIPGYTTMDFFIAKYSQNGDSLDFHVYNFPNHQEHVFDLTAIPGTNEYLAVTSAFSIGMPSPQIVRINHDFELKSNFWFSSPGLSHPCSLNYWLTNSTYLMAVLDYGYGSTNDDQVGIIKADTNADIIESKSLGKLDTIDYPASFNSLEYIDDSSIYLGGYTNYIAFWPTDPSFVELYLLDTNLNLLGYRQFGGDINYRLHGIVAAADGGCLLYTSTYSDSNLYHEHDVRIFKVPRDSVEIITQIIDFSFDRGKDLFPYPNPTSEIIHVPLNNTFENLKIELYKADGKKVLDIYRCIRGNLIILNISHLPSGMYIYNVSSFGRVISSGKFLKI